jgi:hypothetical protein
MRNLAVTSIALFTFANALVAQSQAEACYHLSTLTVGQWASYQISGDGMRGVMEMKMAIVDWEDVDGTEHYWVERQMGAGGVLLQNLVPIYPYAPQEVRATVFKNGDMPATRVDMAGSMGYQGGGTSASYDFVAECNSGELIGRENVDVPAGTISALHLRVPSPDGAEGWASEGWQSSEVSDAWLSTEVGFGLVKVTGPGFEMVLSGHGMDASSAITEESMDIPASSGNGLSEERAYIASMKSDLRNLAIAQEMYFMDNVTYTASMTAAGAGESQGVTMTISNVGVTGWGATAAHNATTRTCAIYFGTAPPIAPADSEGEVKCTT